MSDFLSYVPIVSPKALKKFKKIYKIRFGAELDDAVARDHAQRLLHLIAITRRPVPSKDNKEY